MCNQINLTIFVSLSTFPKLIFHPQNVYPFGLKFRDIDSTTHIVFK